MSPKGKSKSHRKSHRQPHVQLRTPPSVTALPWNRATLVLLATLGDSGSQYGVLASGLITVLKAQLGIADIPSTSNAQLNGLAMRIHRISIFIPPVFQKTCDLAVEFMDPTFTSSAPSGAFLRAVARSVECTTLGPGPASASYTYTPAQRKIVYVEKDNGPFHVAYISSNVKAALVSIYATVTWRSQDGQLIPSPVKLEKVDRPSLASTVSRMAALSLHTVRVDDSDSDDF